MQLDRLGAGLDSDLALSGEEAAAAFAEVEAGNLAALLRERAEDRKKPTWRAVGRRRDRRSQPGGRPVAARSGCDVREPAVRRPNMEYQAY